MKEKLKSGDLVSINMSPHYRNKVGIVISPDAFPNFYGENIKINFSVYKVLINNNIVKFFDFRLEKLQ